MANFIKKKKINNELAEKYAKLAAERRAVMQASANNDEEMVPEEIVPEEITQPEETIQETYTEEKPVSKIPVKRTRARKNPEKVRPEKENPAKEKPVKEKTDSEKKRSKIIYFAIMGVFACVTIFSLFKIIGTLSENGEGSNYYDEIASIAKKDEPKPTKEVTTAAEEKTQPGEQDITEEPTTTEPESEVKEIDFEALWELNKDVVAWISLPGTVIDYPVAQGIDNEQYLRTLLNGKYHRFGTLFVDYKNNPDFTDDVTIIYGHHIYAGDMFCVVEDYADKSFYKQHPYFVFYLPYGTYKLEPYAANYYDNLTLVKTTFADKDEYNTFIQTARDNSPYSMKTSMDANSRTVALYTCSDRVKDGRFVLLCKLTEYN